MSLESAQHGEPQNFGPSGSASRPSSLEYYASLDGLRGIALIGILFYHSGDNWIPGGFLSVSTFFTLSGFLITSLLLYEWERSGRIDLRMFWARRLRRLMPGAILALLVVALLGGTIGDASQVERLSGDGLAALFYVSNWRFIGLGTEYADLFASPSLVQHFWSLSIEEQFYLICPLLLIAALRLRGRRALAIILGAGVIASTLWMAWLYQPDASTSRLYYGTGTRLAEILLGALFAVWHAGRGTLTGRARQLAVGLGVVGICGSLIFWFGVDYTTPWLWQGGFAAYAALTVSVILGGVQPGGPAQRFLSIRPLPWIGQISYGGYLYHFPVYVTVTGELTDLSPWPLFALRIGLTFGLAVVSYYYLERPVRVGQWLRGNALWAAIPAGMAATAVALLVAGVGVDGPADDPEERLSSIQPIVADESQRVFIVGDSVAAALGSHFLAVQSDFGMLTHTSAGSACGFLKSYKLRPWDSAGIVDRRRNCSKLRRRWPQVLEQFEPTIVLMIDDWPGFSEKFVKGRWRSACDVEFERAFSADLADAIGVLSATGATVALTTGPPPFVRDIGGMKVASPSDVEAMMERTTKAVGCQDRVRRAVAARIGVAVIEFAARICPDGGCIREEDGSKLRPDGLHFGGPGGDIVARWLLSEIASLPTKSKAENPPDRR